MKKIFTLIAVLLIAGGLTFHFAALETFNALVPKDADSILWQSDMAYGPHPRQKLDIYMPTAKADKPSPRRMTIEQTPEQRARVEEFQRKHRIVLLTMLFTDVVGSPRL